jgi:asparagine synthase (glutamine-hydrolysing)
MCGITGIFDLTGSRPVDRALLTRMNDSQSHRGPDDAGLLIEPGVGLGHRRLSIIDLSGGHQPICNEDGSVAVIFNGEIYNYRELFKELEPLGHTFKTVSDTEAIVHAWEQWGPNCVQHFRGMFAFALWDRNSETLFLARDRLGIKPLHYALLPSGEVLFGSELKSLMAHPNLAREVDPAAVEEYFALGYIADPRCIFSSVKKLEAGHTLLLRRGAAMPAPRQYWDVHFQSDYREDTPELRHELIERLADAVKVRLISEVPLGAFLSGGVDSSAVVAMMARASAEPVNTCAIAFGDPEFNEAAYAAQIAAQYRTRHSVSEVDPEDCSLVPHLAGVYDEPYADSSALPTYRVCQLAKQRVTVALSGDGGDESFGGYRRYRWHAYEERLRGLLPLGVRRPLFGALGEWYPKLDWAPKVLRGKSTFQALARTAIDGYFHNFALLPDALRRRLYSPRFHSDLQGFHAREVFERYLDRSPEHPLAKVQYIDFKTYLPGDILTKVDRASMAHALEVRVPILDHLFVEWHARIAPELKLKNGQGKYIFKRALEPHLPHDILYRPKMGFAVPLARWFRGPLRPQVRAALLGDSLARLDMFDRRMLAQLVEQHESGRRDFSAAIWSLLMFESFAARCLSSPSIGATPRAAATLVGAAPMGANSFANPAGSEFADDPAPTGAARTSAGSRV